MSAPKISQPVITPDPKYLEAKSRASSQAAANADAIGFEKVITIIGDSIVRMEKGLDNIFDGAPTPSGSRHQNPLDYGLIPLLREVSSIDFCNIFTYLINKAPKFKPYTPNSVSNKSETLFGV